MATRALWRTGKKLALVSTALCVGGAGATIATSDDPGTALKLFTAVPLRLVRDSITAASIVFGRVRIVNFGLFCTIFFVYIWNLIFLRGFYQIMNIHCGDWMKEVLRNQKWNTRFISGRRVNLKSFVLGMVEFISN